MRLRHDLNRSGYSRRETRTSDFGEKRRDGSMGLAAELGLNLYNVNF